MRYSPSDTDFDIYVDKSSSEYADSPIDHGNNLPDQTTTSVPSVPPSSATPSNFPLPTQI